jgi:putative phosphoesterase
MKEIPRIVGVISDTHGLLRPEAAQALHGSDLIIHAGDVGNSDIIAELKTIAPLFVVRGNIDKEAWANDLPANQVVQFGHSSIYVIHDLHDLDLDPEAAGFSAVITGHTHRAHEYRKGKVLFLNPGSAGPKRFDLPITLARLNVEKEPWRVEFIPLSAP